jgi:hypothetical protein
MGMKIEGMKEARSAFNRMRTSIPDAVDDALGEHIQEVYDETQVRVPRKTEALAGSARVTKDSTPRTKPAHRVTYGEPGEGEGVIDYAAAVHEILDAEHAPPTGAKYVEQPLLESIPHAQKTVKKHIKDRVKEEFR